MFFEPVNGVFEHYRRRFLAVPRTRTVLLLSGNVFGIGKDFLVFKQPLNPVQVRISDLFGFVARPFY